MEQTSIFQKEVCQPFFHQGSEDGILLMHGFTGSAAHMRKIADALAQKGYTVSTINLPGHATTEADMAKSTWQEWLQAAKQATLDLKAQCKRVTVCGLSMGGVLALLADSTNVERPGYTMSEKKIAETFRGLFKDAKKRIIIATFSSNVHRVQQIIDTSAHHGRKVAITGRSMLNIVSAATELGYMTIPSGVLIDINEVKRLIEKYEMPVRGFTPEHNAYPFNYMIGSEAQREDAVNYLKLCLDMAKEMGAEFVLTSPANGGYLATYDQLWTRLEKTIRELGDHAAKVGVKLTVEALTPYESNFFTRANDLVELFRRIDNPWIVGMCDVVPPFVQHESIMAYFDKLGDKMDHMHIIDGDNGTDSHIMPGEGSMPLPEMFYELKRIGYDRTATLELVTGYINEPRMYAKRAIDNVRAMMAQVGM